jgi:E1A-binding protein p400
MFLYEEFMGRSSTRMAVKKKGNFLGMMNVLMQLRKVCNHPDLFDPRSILTPLFTDSIQLRVPGFSVNALETSPYKRVSASIIHSLWSKSSGIPYFNLSLDYDSIVAAQVQSLQGLQVEINETVSTEKNYFQKPHRYSPGLLSLLTSIWACESSDAQSIAKNVATVSSKRCQSDAFPYNNRTRQTVSVKNIFTEIAENGKFDLSATRIAQTPTQLLEMMRTYQERSDELDSLIERFVFCVPRAGARHPECISTSLFKSEGLYLPELEESFQCYFSPFKKAASRLTSFFPEHKLGKSDFRRPRFQPFACNSFNYLLHRFPT